MDPNTREWMFCKSSPWAFFHLEGFVKIREIRGYPIRRMGLAGPSCSKIPPIPLIFELSAGFWVQFFKKRDHPQRSSLHLARPASENCKLNH
jgi:hypothetical protein